MTINKKQLGDDLYTFSMTTTRCMKLFLRDKMSVFFALLAPFIVLLLYVLFLGDMQKDTVLSMMQGILQTDKIFDEKAISSFVACWMVAGVITVAIITVSLNANTIMVEDKSRGVCSDSLASPAKQWVINLSYYFFNFIVTLFIVGVTTIICFIYLAAIGGFYMSTADVFALIGTIILGTLSATTITVLVTSAFKSVAVLGGFAGIISAGIGFLTGAFMPMSIMPAAARYISALIPGSYAGGMIRNFMMRGSLENLTEGLPDILGQELGVVYDLNIDFFGINIDIPMMALILGVSTIAFALINIAVRYGVKYSDKQKSIKARESAMSVSTDK